MVNNFAAFKSEIEGEKTIEADEVKLLNEAAAILLSSIKQLVITKDESDKQRSASMEAFQALANDIGGKFNLASNEIALAMTKLKNSIADEERLRQVANGVAEKARKSNAVLITAVETKAMNLAKSHESTITKIITELERIKESLDIINRIPPNELGKKYFNLDNVRKMAISRLEIVIKQINNYVNGLRGLFKIFNIAEGKKPAWKFW